jgi:hypothetical protein
LKNDGHGWGKGPQSCFDDETFEIYREYANQIVDYRDHLTVARCRFLVAAIGHGFSATYFSLLPWKTDHRTNALANILVQEIQKLKEDGSLPIARTLDSLEEHARIKGRMHMSLVAKIGHVVWPSLVPVYDKNSSRCASAIDQEFRQFGDNRFQVHPGTNGLLR